MDIARGLAALFMVAIHVLEVFANEEVEHSPVGYAVRVLGGAPAAPVFMFVMGCGLVFSHRATPGLLLQRGLRLLGAGYLLNLLRFALPFTVGGLAWHNPQLLDDAVEEFFSVDILHFAGLTLVFFALVRRLEWSRLALAVVTAALTGAGLSLMDIEAGSTAMRSLSGLLWGSHQATYFPFLSWIWYPVAGFLFASLLIKTDDARRLYLVSLIAGGAVWLATEAALPSTSPVALHAIDEIAFYHQGPLHTLALVAFVHTLIACIYFARRAVPRLIERALARWSRNITAIYCIHWVCIGNLAMLIGGDRWGLAASTLLFVGLLAFSDMAASWYAARRPSQRREANA